MPLDAGRSQTLRAARARWTLPLSSFPCEACSASRKMGVNACRGDLACVDVHARGLRQPTDVWDAPHTAPGQDLADVGSRKCQRLSNIAVPEQRNARERYAGTFRAAF